MKMWFVVTVMSFVFVGCGRLDASSQGEVSSSDSSAQEMFVEIGDTDTFLKKSTDQASGIDVNEKCFVASKTRLNLLAQPEMEKGHYFVKLSDPLEKCDFKEGYIFQGHVAKASKKPGLFSSNMRAFLDVIAYAEGTLDSYNLTFAFRTFSDYSRHPALLICSGGYCSDAAGRYQIKSDTWRDVRRELGLPDFSPESQDRAAVQLIKWRGGYDDVERIDGPNTFSNSLYTVRKEWASLPHSPYGQPTKTVGELWRKFQDYKTRY